MASSAESTIADNWEWISSFRLRSDISRAILAAPITRPVSFLTGEIVTDIESCFAILPDLDGLIMIDSFPSLELS